MEKLKSKAKRIFYILKESFNEFGNNNGVKLSASLSYYTIFSLPPLLFIIIYLSSLFFGPEAVRGEIFGQINALVGDKAAVQIEEMIKSVRFSKGSTLAGIIGALTLIAGASGVFSEMQDSMNLIWNLKAKPRRGLFKIIQNRLISFSMVMSLAFLLMVSLVINALVEILNGELQKIFPGVAVLLFYILNQVLLLAIITLLFSIIFKALPDGKIYWKDTFTGALFTAFLFMIGKFAIGIYLGHSNVASGYGAAGSLIIILLWVYYSANILYFGASFTKVYAYKYGRKILPNRYAVFTHQEKIANERKKDAA